LKLYHRPFLERMPQRAAAVVAVIADAEPGGVLVHCAAGQDRAGRGAAARLGGVDAAMIAALEAVGRRDPAVGRRGAELRI